MSFIGNLKEILGMDAEDENENDFETFGDPGESYDDEAGKRNKVVNIHATAQLQVILVKPEVFQDTKQIADHLNSKKTVVQPGIHNSRCYKKNH